MLHSPNDDALDRIQLYGEALSAPHPRLSADTQHAIDAIKESRTSTLLPDVTPLVTTFFELTEQLPVICNSVAFAIIAYAKNHRITPSNIREAISAAQPTLEEGDDTPVCDEWGYALVPADILDGEVDRRVQVSVDFKSAKRDFARSASQALLILAHTDEVLQKGLLDDWEDIARLRALIDIRQSY